MKLRNITRMGTAAFCANVWQRRAPLNIMLSVTDRCNSNCCYCNIPNRRQRELTTEEIFSLIDQAARMGTQRIGLWGGEPLIRDDIGQIIDYAKNKGLFVTLDSNGHLIEEKYAHLKNLDHLILALDGPEEMHDKNRGKGSFQKLMKGIESIKGKIVTWTITVLTKFNLECIDFILELAKNYGFLATFQVLHHNDILGRNLESLLPSDASYRKVIRDIILKKKRGAYIASTLPYLRHILNWPDYKKPMLSCPVNNLKCWAGRLYCNIDTDGSVYPCSLLIGKVRSLNFLDAGFRKAFDSLQNDSCMACAASCFTEYNYLYSLDIATIIEWLNSMKKTSRHLCKKIN